jgi:hypothetical protein
MGFLRNSSAALGVMFAMVLLSAAQGSPTQIRDFVPDEVTAVRIAEAVFIPVYGEKHMKAERPFHARLDGDYWIVSGSVGKPKSKDFLVVGGTMMAEINRKTGEIRTVYHLK